MNFQVSFDISLTKPSQKEGCFIVTSLQWPRWYFRVLLLIMSRFRHLEKPIKTKENKRKHFVFICFYWFCLVFLEGESKSPHRLQVYLLPLEGVRGVNPSLGEGLGGLLGFLCFLETSPFLVITITACGCACCVAVRNEE